MCFLNTTSEEGKSLKYSLNSNDHKSLKISFRTVYNNWQARVTERLVGNYIEDVIIPALKHQGWSEVIYAQDCAFGYEDESEKPVALQGFWNKGEQRFLIANGLCPTEEFIKTFRKLTRLLKHSPDGYLLKFKKTGKVKPLKEALKELDLRNLKNCG